MVWVWLHFLPCIRTIIDFVFLGFARNDYFPTQGLLPLMDKLCEFITYPIHLILRVFVSMIHPAEVEFGLRRRRQHMRLRACLPMPCCSTFRCGCTADLTMSWGGW